MIKNIPMCALKIGNLFYSTIKFEINKQFQMAIKCNPWTYFREAFKIHETGRSKL